MFDGMVLTFAFMENMTAYEDGDMNATTAAENVLDILYAMADEGFFDHHDDHHDDDHHDDDTMMTIMTMFIGHNGIIVNGKGIHHFNTAT